MSIWFRKRLILLGLTITGAKSPSKQLQTIAKKGKPLLMERLSEIT